MMRAVVLASALSCLSSVALAADPFMCFATPDSSIKVKVFALTLNEGVPATVEGQVSLAREGRTHTGSFQGALSSANETAFVYEGSFAQAGGECKGKLSASITAATPRSATFTVAPETSACDAFAVTLPETPCL